MWKKEELTSHPTRKQGNSKTNGVSAVTPLKPHSAQTCQLLTWFVDRRGRREMADGLGRLRG